METISTTTSVTPTAPAVTEATPVPTAAAVPEPQTLAQVIPPTEAAPVVETSNTTTDASVPVQPVANAAKSAKKRKIGVSQSSRAGLSFPVGRVARLLKRSHKGPVSAGSAVYMAAVMEYLSAEVLEAAGQIAKNRKQKRIDNRSVYFAMQSDAELQKLYFDMNAPIVPGSGVIPNPQLWTKRPKTTKATAQK